VDDEALLRCKKQEEQHLAARRGGDQSLFRIDRSRNRIGKGYARGSRGSRDLDASVEAPGVAAAVLVVEEGCAVPFPFDSCVIIMRHIMVLWLAWWPALYDRRALIATTPIAAANDLAPMRADAARPPRMMRLTTMTMGGSTASPRRSVADRAG